MPRQPMPKSCVAGMLLSALSASAASAILASAPCSQGYQGMLASVFEFQLTSGRSTDLHESVEQILAHSAPSWKGAEAEL